MRGNWEPLQDSEKGKDMIQAGEKHSCCVWRDPALFPIDTYHTTALQVWTDGHQREDAGQDMVVGAPRLLPVASSRPRLQGLEA